MTQIVFFPGRYSLDQLGAVSVVTSNLFPGPVSELSGAIIGIGRFAKTDNVPQAFNQIDLLPQYLRRSFFYRAILKICREHLPDLAWLTNIQRWNEYRLSVVADNLAAEQLNHLLKSRSDIKIALGYTGDSLKFGQAAKKAGLCFIVHSQFCHPYVQNTLVANAYESLNIPPPEISSLRLERQLETLELADAIWCPTEFVRQSLINNGISEDKTFVTYLGIDTDSFYVDPTDRSTDSPFTILFIGRVCIQKGVHILLEALALTQLPDVRVIFNGQPDLVSQQIIEEFQARLEPQNIKIVIDPGDPRRNLKHASIFVLPSVHDSFGIVVLEAMAAGLPVIVSDHVGAKELVRHGDNGFVFPSGDSQALAEKIKYFFENHEMQAQFGKTSYLISQAYSLQQARINLDKALLEKC